MRGIRFLPAAVARAGLLAAVLWVAAPPAGAPAAEAQPPVLSERLPSVPLPCPLTGEEARPDETLRGRPAVLFFTDARTGAATELARFAAGLQEEYGPWLAWAGVLVGRAEPAEAERLRRDSPLRFTDCWQDRDGSWREAFRVAELPAAVLVSPDGYVVRRVSGSSAGEREGFVQGLERAVRASRLAGRAARDFKLRESGSATTRTLAEVAPREFAILLSLRSDCGSCVDELDALRAVRDRHPTRVSLAAVYHEPGRVAAAAPGGPATSEPDFVLEDPSSSYAGEYSVEGVPFLVVVDPRGLVVMARSGFTPQEVPALTAAIEALLDAAPARGEEAARFAEFRRVRSEGLALLAEGEPGLAALFIERALEICPEFYTLQPCLADAYRGIGKRREAAIAYQRYLSAEPRAVDRAEIEERLRSLGDGR